MLQLHLQLRAVQKHFSGDVQKREMSGTRQLLWATWQRVRVKITLAEEDRTNWTFLHVNFWKEVCVCVCTLQTNCCVFESLCSSVENTFSLCLWTVMCLYFVSRHLCMLH